MDTKDTTKHLSTFKRARDEAVHSEPGELTHHLVEFVREVQRNPLCQDVLAALPAYDAEAWWKVQTEGDRWLRTLSFPDDPDEKLVVLWDLVLSMGSDSHEKLDFHGFGSVFGVRKTADAAAKAISLVVRPFAEEMTERVRERVNLASPQLRELAGVPLAAIPAEDESRIFLSHRSSDKDLVRPYYELLRELGYDPWIDDHEMPAGTTLHRGIAEGMDASCAVVFFVTESFEDERWLAREVDHAVHRKIERGDKFTIIPLVFGGVVPRALKEVVWVNATDPIDTMREIIRALPIELGPPRWRAKIWRK